MAEIIITPFAAADRERWTELWRGYLEFYEIELPPEIYDHTWRRLMTPDGAVRGLGARPGAAAQLAGIVHYFFHPHAWSPRDVCYLQDLFVDPSARRRGIGEKLIAAVAAVARERNCLRLYWTTKEDNLTARSLYDRIARFNGFIRYDYALE